MDKLRDFAREQNATVFMTLLTAFQVFLHRYSGDDDLVVGTPIAGRSQPELEPLMGFFLNTLAIRGLFEESQSFAACLKKTRRTVLDAFAHQDLPFEKLVEELQPERSMSHSPVFQTLFIWQESGRTAPGFSGLNAGIPEMLGADTAKFDLTLSTADTGNGLEIGFEYNTDLFEAATIERMLGHFETLLESIVASPDTPVDELPLIADAERSQVIDAFNATDAELPVSCVHSVVEQTVASSPDAVAVVAGDQSLSYAELNARANVLAAALIQAGVTPNTHVALSVERGLNLPVAVLGVLKAGGAYVPVDPNYPAERISYMLESAEPAVVVTTAGVSLPEGVSVPVIDVDGLDFSAAADNPTTSVSPNDALYTIYTSGSTGKPKGVSLSHRGLNNLLQWQNRQPHLGEGVKTLQFASLSFDVSFQELFSTFTTGGTLVMIDEDLRRDLPQLAKFIADQQIKRVYFPFAALQPLAEAAGDLSFVLEDVIVAGEQLQVTPAVRDLFKGLSNARLHNQYGPSETHVVTALTLEGDPDNWPALPSIGTPVANTRAYVLDEHLTPSPVGVPGELYLGGTQVAIGYYNRPELNEEKLLASPFVDGERLYRTGDRVRFLDNGEIEFLGRVDDQVKWRGFRIEPGEIETLLAEHPNVTQAAVIIREDRPGEKRLVGYIQPSGEADMTDIRNWLKDRVPEYMVPQALVVLDAFPLTPSGKLARRLLPEPDWEDAGETYVAPTNDTEATLCEIWQAVLGLPKVGIHDDFFELGGHSLLATQLVSRIRDAFGIEMPLKYVFRHATPASLALPVDTLSQALAAAAQGPAEDDADREEFRL